MPRWTPPRRPRCWRHAASARPAVCRRRTGPRRRAGGGRAARRGDLLPQGLHPAHPAVPRPVPLLHVRHGARASCAGGRRTSPPTRSSTSPAGRRAGLQGGAVHPRRPARGPLARGARSGWTSRATTRRWTTSGRWRSGCWRRPGCCRTSTPGSCRWAEINRLKPVAPSMGMMLETTSRRLFTRPGASRTSARPTRTPRSGCGCWRTPGGSSVPFTTGLLVGIGETLEERAETIFALRRVARATAPCRR